jgi:4-hydroxy-3-methylbut-2-enyl diphosphate reductase
VKVSLAMSAGFCGGVRSAVRRVYNEARKGKIYTLGSVIHNRRVTEGLAGLGVRVARTAADVPVGSRVAIRSHGVPPRVYEDLRKRGVDIIDCTCPFVAGIQRLAREASVSGKTVIVAGDASHPEVIGIIGWAGRAVVFGSADEARASDLSDVGECVLLAQSTLRHGTYAEIAEVLSARGVAVECRETICGATRARQDEAARLSAECGAMVVLGDADSSNARKLAEVCAERSDRVFFGEDIWQALSGIREWAAVCRPDIIGITAGASTPPAIIKEAVRLMSEFENPNGQGAEDSGAPDVEIAQASVDVVPEAEFEQMLNESLVTLHTGDYIRGTVISVTPTGEVSVNIGFKSDGLIQRSEFSDDPNKNPADYVKPGDEIDVFVIRVNDGEGNVLLSKKRVDSQKSLDEFEAAVAEKSVFTGKVVDAVKGGLIAVINEVRAFVPSSQIAGRYVEDTRAYVGQELDFNILEVDKSKRRVIAGRRELARRQAAEKKELVFNALDIGAVVTGKVSRIADFGAFVDLGGVDGLIHISELGWNRVKHVSDALSEGDEVTATVININRDKEKISLSLRTEENNPWYSAVERYPVGSIVEGKVVRLVPFGAFIEFPDGIDGLVHISQIAEHRIEKPEDELELGQFVRVQVTNVDVEKKKLSLSKKLADRAIADAEREAYDAERESEYESEEFCVNPQDSENEA